MGSRTEQHYISIASGIGGLDLGVELGSNGNAIPVCYVEIEATAAAVLAARMGEGALPEAPIWDDLHTFDSAAWRGLVDGIVGGYPCQPFSVAGRKRGFEDPKNLWPRIEQLISEVRPSWCFFENVEGHIRLGYFDSVKPGLESLGYRVEEQICAASNIGATHQRKRIFILAVADPSSRRRSQDSLYTGGITFRSEGQAFPPPPDATEEWRDIIKRRPDLAPAIEPKVRGVVNGPARGLGFTIADQLRLLGNGVVPQQAALAWRILWKVMNGEMW